MVCKNVGGGDPGGVEEGRVKDALTKCSTDWRKQTRDPSIFFYFWTISLDGKARLLLASQDSS